MTRDTKSLDDLFCEYEIKLDNKNYTLKGTPKALISVEKKFGALNTILSKELTIEENAFIIFHCIKDGGEDSLELDEIQACLLSNNYADSIWDIKKFIVLCCSSPKDREETGKKFDSRRVIMEQAANLQILQIASSLGEA